LAEKPHENDNFASHRKYLIALLLLNSGTRTGVTKNMTMQEVQNIEKVEVEQSDGTTKKYFVVSVTSHKTCYQGQVPMSNREYKALKNMCEIMEMKHNGATHPFVTSEGTPFTTSRVSREWAKVSSDSGMLQKYGVFTLTDNRKHVISHMLKCYPEMQEQISKQMKNSLQTEDFLRPFDQG
jgi:hypothetical protein